MKSITKLSWTSEIAYAVGLIATDGNLSPDGRHFDFTSKDIDLIETFRKCLGIKNKITRKKGTFTGEYASRLQFGNVVLYKQLLSIGLTPNKSKTIGVLQIPDPYFFDFLRGSLDGDGSISTYNDPLYKNSIRLYTRFTSASLKHATWLKEKIECLAGIKGFIRKGARCFDLTYSKRDSILLLHKIYYKESLPCLKRKFNLARKFLG